MFCQADLWTDDVGKVAKLHDELEEHVLGSLTISFANEPVNDFVHVVGNFIGDVEEAIVVEEVLVEVVLVLEVPVNVVLGNDVREDVVVEVSLWTGIYTPQ